MHPDLVRDISKALTALIEPEPACKYQLSSTYGVLCKTVNDREVVQTTAANVNIKTMKTSLWILEVTRLQRSQVNKVF